MTPYQVKILLSRISKDGVPQVMKDGTEVSSKKEKKAMMQEYEREDQIPKHVSWVGPGKPIWQMTKAERREMVKAAKGAGPGESSGLLPFMSKDKKAGE